MSKIFYFSQKLQGYSAKSEWTSKCSFMFVRQELHGDSFRRILQSFSVFRKPEIEVLQRLQRFDRWCKYCDVVRIRQPTFEPLSSSLSASL